jgi:hypothetical protein
VALSCWKGCRSAGRLHLVGHNPVLSVTYSCPATGRLARPDGVSLSVCQEPDMPQDVIMSGLRPVTGRLPWLDVCPALLQMGANDVSAAGGASQAAERHLVSQAMQPDRKGFLFLAMHAE